eukprot:IDg13146t1
MMADERTRGKQDKKRCDRMQYGIARMGARARNAYSKYILYTILAHTLAQRAALSAARANAAREERGSEGAKAGRIHSSHAVNVQGGSCRNCGRAARQAGDGVESASG